MAEKNGAQKQDPAKADPKVDRKEEMKENIIAIVIVLILVAGLSWWLYARFTTPPAVPAGGARAEIPLGASPVLGNENASMTVVEFSDFECPFCGQFAREDFQVIKREYIDTGKAKLVFKQFPLTSHPDAEKAAEASLCAQDQGKFWEYHDLLYANQQKLGIPDLERYAGQLGLNTTAFNACLESGQRATDVALDKQLGERVGVSGTPTFYFNGRQAIGVLSPAEFGAQVAQS
jgi:protein-disulfide isomerase